MPLQKNSSPLEGTERFKTFTDGFIAIVMTILVLELRVPHIDQASFNSIIDALQPLLPKFLVFIASFVTIAVCWVNHHHLSHSIKKTDTSLLWYNNHLLFWICLIPFVTSFLGDHPTSSLVVAIYGFVLFMVALASHILLTYIYIRSNLVSTKVTARSKKSLIDRSRVGVILYGLSVLSAFIHPFISCAIFILVPVYFFFPQQVEN